MGPFHSLTEQPCTSGWLKYPIRITAGDTERFQDASGETVWLMVAFDGSWGHWSLRPTSRLQASTSKTGQLRCEAS